MSDIAVERPALTLLPPKPWYKRISTLAIVGVIGVLIMALAAVTFALLTTNSRADDLKDQLTCRARPVALVDQKTGDDLAALGANQAQIGSAQAITLEGLNAFAHGDDAGLQAALVNVPTQVQALMDSAALLNKTAQELQDALNARDLSITTCTK